MPALVAGIHDFCTRKTWMAGTSLAMTERRERRYKSLSALPLRVGR
jgi:hypothetical protein